MDNAKENGRNTATNKEVLNSLKDSKEAKAIAEALRKVWAYLDGEVIVDVDKLARLLDKTESLSQAMREYKKGRSMMITLKPKRSWQKPKRMLLPERVRMRM